MGTLDLTTQAGVSADAAWAVLADFPGFLNWAGQGRIRIEGEGVGMIRHLDIPGTGAMAERLDRLDHADRIIGYTLVYGTPAGMAEYRAEVALKPTGENACNLAWHGEFTAAPGHDEVEVANNLSAAYEGMTQALTAYVQASSQQSQ